MIEYLLVALYLWLSLAMYLTIKKYAEFGNTTMQTITKKQRIILGITWPLTLAMAVRKKR